jgi:hypothetical protein
MQKTILSTQGPCLWLATMLGRSAHGDKDPAFFTLLAMICTQFLPNVQVKDVLGTLPLNHHRTTGKGCWPRR